MVACCWRAYAGILWDDDKVAELELRREQMKVVRIYTGADNQTHFEDLPLETFAT